MKNSVNVLLILCCIFSIFLISCEEDSSTLATNPLPDVVVDTTGMSEISVLQFEELNVSPDISLEGLNESDVSYEWRLYPVPHDTISEVIGEERDLGGYQVELTPTIGDQLYRVTLTVTDQQNDLEYVTAWRLQVLNSMGEGLVVAETTEGGANTDISLIMSPEVTTDFSEMSIKRNIYSSLNDGKTIEGIVKDMQFTQVFGENVLFTITDNSIVRINTLDYTYVGKNSDLFFYNPPTYSPQALGVVNQNGTYNVYIANNKFTGTGATDKRFLAPLDSDLNVPNQTAINEESSASTIVSFYEEENGVFASLNTLFSLLSNGLQIAEPVSEQDFDPANVSNKENIVANAASNGNFRHLLRDKTTGEYHLYVLTGNDPPAPFAKYDFTDAPEIDNAQHFVLPDNQRVMYYATDTKIYAALYSTSTPVFEERYTAPAGEEITTLQLYHAADYPTAESYLDTDGRQLVMSTYDGSEGRVYLLPITNLGVGNIDEANVTSFEGFGRITAITPQK